MFTLWITPEEMWALGHRYNCALSLNKLLEWYSQMDGPEEFSLEEDVNLLFIRRLDGDLYGTWVELEDLYLSIGDEKKKKVLIRFC